MLAAAYETAQKALPNLMVERQRFYAFVRERRDPAQTDLAIEDDVAADLYLACACLDGDSQALALFDQRYLSLVPQFLAGLESAPAQIEEVTQLMRERLFVGDGRIGHYRGNGRLPSWLRVMAIRTALNQRRKRSPSGPAELDGLIAAPDPELDYLRDHYKGAFHEAFAASLATLEARDLTVLRLHLLDGLNIDKIGQLYDVHRATVARWIAGTRDALFQGTRDRLKNRLRMSDSEFESILRLVRSELDVSICRILADAEQNAAG